MSGVASESFAAEPSKADKPCPICGGTGEVTYVDEEVGCRVTEPCWSCQLPPVPPAPDT